MKIEWVCGGFVVEIVANRWWVLFGVGYGVEICCPMWWKSVWSYGGCGIVIGFVNGFVLFCFVYCFFFFFLTWFCSWWWCQVCVVQRWWACGDSGFNKFVVLEQKE